MRRHPLHAALTVLGLVSGIMFVAWWAVAQNDHESPPPPPKKPAPVKGFADVVRERKKGAEEKEDANALEWMGKAMDGTKGRWLAVLKSLQLHPPTRSEGWKFANYGLRRWRGVLASRGGSVLRWRIITMEATAYCPRGCCGSGGGRTATGRRAEYGVVAVDPQVIPLGTALYVDNYGFSIAADVGRAIKGNRIDLCYPTHREANRFGRRKVRVLLFR